MSIIHTNNPRLSPKNAKRDFNRRKAVAVLSRELKALERTRAENIDLQVGRILFLKKILKRLFELLGHFGRKEYGTSVSLASGLPKDPMAYPEAAKKGMLWSK
jgi:hypothetical protein